MTRRLFLAALAAVPLAALRPPVPAPFLFPRWTPGGRRGGKSEVLWTVVGERVRMGESVLWIDHNGALYQCDQDGVFCLIA